MTHTVLTFISRVKPEKAEELRTLLKQIGDDPENNPYIPFRKLELLHFASLVLHEPAKDEEKKEYGPYLIFENNFDGPLDIYLNALCGQFGKGLHQIYGYCQDYTVTKADDCPEILTYLKAHVVRPNAYHIGNTGRSVLRILEEQKLRDGLESRADGLIRDRRQASPNRLLDVLRSFVRSDSELSGLPKVVSRQTLLQRYIPWVNLGLQGLLAVSLILALSPLVIIAGLVLLRKEKNDPVQSSAADSGNVRKLVEREDRTHNVQNHMASITVVKPGWLRRVTLWIVLRAVNLLARARATHGELSGIPSIHFAHWSVIDNGRRLLFLSNFDGSWENYLDDFIDKAHEGLTEVWSNTVDFPRTRFLYKDGATDGPRFKAVARDSQTVTNAWYSAYRDLTVPGIDNNSSIREDIFKPLSDQATATWLQRL